MSNKYKAVPIFWTATKGGTHQLKNLETLQDLLRDGWRVTRVDVPPDNNKSDISDTILMYILEQAPDEETRKTINEETRKTINEARACLESHGYDCYGCEDVLDGSTTIGDALTYACATSNKERTAKLLYYMGQPPAPSIMSGGWRRYFAIPHMARRLQNGYASAAWRPAARTRPSSCSSHPVQIRDGGTGISSIARRSDSYRAAYGLRQTASRAALHHSRPRSWSCGRERDNNHGGTQ